MTNRQVLSLSRAIEKYHKQKCDFYSHVLKLADAGVSIDQLADQLEVSRGSMYRRLIDWKLEVLEGGHSDY